MAQTSQAGAGGLTGAGEKMPHILARMIDRDVKAEPDGRGCGGVRSDRADFIFLTGEQLGRRYLKLRWRDCLKAAGPAS